MGKKSDAGQRTLRNALLAGLGGAVLTLLLVLLAALLCKNGWLRQGREALWARGALLLASLLAGIAAVICWIAGTSGGRIGTACISSCCGIVRGSGAFRHHRCIHICIISFIICLILTMT